jgi:nanoRNase/pAp phosphatase (c-di-AMP/oligoRNAs hydrolase)
MPQDNKKYRLLTRSDFDGLICAVLLKEIDLVDEVAFAHPKDMQEGRVRVGAKDITTNLPYVEGVALCFDHHASETLREKPHPNHIIIPSAHSAARVVYDYYGGKKTFPPRYDEILSAADKIDAAHYELDEVLYPKGWTLLGFLTDSRTGLGRFRDFRISNYDLMMKLIDVCGKKDIEAILEDPDVKERIDLYNSQEELYREQLRRTSRVEKNVLVVDLREEKTVYVGNRFLRYALYPKTNISLQVLWGLKKQNSVITLGKSIFNKSSATDIGTLLFRYGGGGHENAGTCQVPNETADAAVEAILREIVEP